MKKIARISLRKLFQAKEQEPIRDAIRRHQVNFYRKTDPVKYGLDDVNKAIRALGLRSGDSVMVHCQWRSFYGLQDGNPLDIIKILQDIVGESGGILMPSYGREFDTFSVEETPSAAGVLSEAFRRMPQTLRVGIPLDSTSGWGKRAHELMAAHKSCRYGYDEFSPYSKMCKCEGRVLLLGMGRRPSKISAFHCAVWENRNRIETYENIWRSFQWTCIERGQTRIVDAIARKNGIENNNHAFKCLFASVPKSVQRLGQNDLILFDAGAAFDICEKALEDGLKLYTGK